MKFVGGNYVYDASIIQPQCVSVHVQPLHVRAVGWCFWVSMCLFGISASHVKVKFVVRHFLVSTPHYYSDDSLFSTRWPPNVYRKDNHVLAIMVR